MLAKQILLHVAKIVHFQKKGDFWRLKTSFSENTKILSASGTNRTVLARYLRYGK